jgi:hypothetical protein
VAVAAAGARHGDAFIDSLLQIRLEAVEYARERKLLREK